MSTCAASADILSDDIKSADIQSPDVKTVTYTADLKETDGGTTDRSNKKKISEGSSVQASAEVHVSPKVQDDLISEKLNIPDKPQMVDPEMQEAVDEVDAPSPLLVWNGQEWTR